MKKPIYIILIALSAVVCACSEPTGAQEPDDVPAATDGNWHISGVEIPENIVVKSGDEVKFHAEGITEGDILTIEGEDTFETGVNVLGKNLFSFTVPSELKTGIYDISLQRDGRSQMLATSYIAIITGDEIPDIEGKNVKGIVHCGGTPIEGVVVSDGKDVAATNAYGMYWIESEKKTDDYIFISIPSGYKCASNNGVVPLFFKHTDGSESYMERIDFELEEEKEQDRHRILVLGDMHLAGRPQNNDVEQFQSFIQDINGTVAGTSVPVYGLTLGDMTWDTFWYTNSFFFADYLAEINKVQNLTIFHTIGNHDHESGYSGNWPVGDYATASKYKAALGPTYYSFNIGKIHYVVLDDIECTNDGSGATTYNVRITPEQISWLKKDLSYVDKDRTLVLASHSHIHNKTGGQVLENYDDLMTVIDDFKDVHIFTGHTHLVYNWNVEGYYDNIMEHNAGAVCATWWWSGKHTPGIHICQDGAPGGYTILDVSGDELEWQYKPVGRDVNFQFRTYDGNEVLITRDDCRGSESAKDGFIDNYVDNPFDWSVRRNDNAVYINVWNWDPEWKVEVTENGRKLDVEKVSLRDPLHLVAYTGKSMAGTSKTDVFATSVNEHFFKAVAKEATSTLEITVTDRFGNEYKESMERPKEFSIENYK